MRTHTKQTQSSVTPEHALGYLAQGNRRFRENLRAHRDLLQQVNETREGQFPFATILSCIDSRTSAEIIFDQGLGDIFSIRIAGNVVNDDILGSMEFASKLAGSRLVVVLGHRRCGAIAGACDRVQLGNLSTLLNKIQPAVDREQTVETDRTGKNMEFVDKVAAIQVRRSVDAVVERSVVLRQMIESGAVGLVGAMYDVETGEVHFLDDTLMIGEVRTTSQRAPAPGHARKSAAV